MRLSRRGRAPSRCRADLEPMLATAAPAAAGRRRLGVRDQVGRDPGARVHRRRGGLRIAARRGADHTPRYPELAALDRRVRRARGDPRRRDRRLRRVGAAELSAPPAADGARPTETTIRLRAAETPATYVAFDLLWLDGAFADRRSPTRRAASARRARLRRPELAGAGPPRRRRASGCWAAIRERGLEGVVAKRLGSPYRPGKRSREWLKVRYRRGQELVIGGWMPGEGSRGGRVGSLLVGHWDATPEEAEQLGRPQRLVYAGGVGTGFTQETLDAADRSARAARVATNPRSSSARIRASSTRSEPATAAPARSGSSRSWSARSSSPSGPGRAPCASRRSRACATTRTRARCVREA